MTINLLTRTELFIAQTATNPSMDQIIDENKVSMTESAFENTTLHI